MKRIKKTWTIRFEGTEHKSKLVGEGLRVVMGSLNLYAGFGGIDSLKIEESP